MKIKSYQYRNVMVRVERSSGEKLNLYLNFSGNEYYVATVSYNRFIADNFRNGVKLNYLERLSVGSGSGYGRGRNKQNNRNESALKHLTDLVNDFILYSYEYERVA